MNIIDVMIDAGMTKTRSEAKRLIKSRSIEYDNKIILTNCEFISKENAILRVGRQKRRIKNQKWHWEKLDDYSARVIF